LTCSRRKFRLPSVLICSIFNGLVAPIPVIQLVNLFDGLATLALEWPLPFLPSMAIQRAFGLRFALYPIMAVAAFIQYQCTDPAFYLLIGTAYVPSLSRLMGRVYVQASMESEIIGVTGAPQKGGRV
jgi:hypothetical protein